MSVKGIEIIIFLISVEFSACNFNKNITVVDIQYIILYCGFKLNSG